MIKRELSDILVKEISDPRLDSLTIQSVEVSPDLRRAKIFYSKLDSQFTEAEIEEALARAMGFFRRHLSRNIRLRYTPELIFLRDRTQETRERIDSLLEQIKKV